MEFQRRNLLANFLPGSRGYSAVQLGATARRHLHPEDLPDGHLVD
jgi:hypothetical protein